MKQLQKSDLKEGEIYKQLDFNYIFLYNKNETSNSFNDGTAISTTSTRYCKRWTANGFEKPMVEATPEEKHWLRTCIKADQFVSYEEAIKTFIPEFVLPEKWAIIITNENKDIVNKYRKSIFNNSNISCNLNVDNIHLSDRYDGTYYHYNKHYFKEHTRCKEITTEQFKQYVLKEKPKVVFEEPKDKVLTLSSNYGKESIVKVECSEGGIYKIGDKIRVFSGSKNPVFRNKQYFTIQSFRWSNDKSKICAVFNAKFPNGIGLDKIELYVEPKVKFVLPEKWCVEVNDEIRNRIGYCEAYGYHHSIQINNTNKWSNKIKEGFTEITFEQFKKYVLKDE